MIGQTLLGRYTVDARLGEGGMGEVWRALDERGSPVAIKRLHGEIAGSPELAARFEREAQALAMLAHPNIAALHAVGTRDDGGMFFVMEYVEGHDLATELEAGRLAPARAVALVRQLLGALHHAHQFGLIHRDLKPENVLLTRGEAGEQIKIIDFGLVKMVGDVLGAEGQARLTATGVIFGTPDYMAPEQMLEQPVDPRTDLYAVGILLFELLTGRRPFESEEISEVWRAHLSAPVPRLRDIDPALDHPDLDAILELLLAKRPEQRFETALAARRALESLALST
ncbi:serine/threonine-protein kinase [Nannocystaceae bacterium ST9]